MPALPPVTERQDDDACHDTPHHVTDTSAVTSTSSPTGEPTASAPKSSRDGGGSVLSIAAQYARHCANSSIWRPLSCAVPPTSSSVSGGGALPVKRGRRVSPGSDTYRLDDVLQDLELLDELISNVAFYLRLVQITVRQRTKEFVAP